MSDFPDPRYQYVYRGGEWVPKVQTDGGDDET